MGNAGFCPSAVVVPFSDHLIGSYKVLKGTPQKGTTMDVGIVPKAPCTHVVDTEALKYLPRDSFKA